jgi:hypothetical protein
LYSYDAVRAIHSHARGRPPRSTNSPSQPCSPPSAQARPSPTKPPPALPSPKTPRQTDHHHAPRPPDPARHHAWRGLSRSPHSQTRDNTPTHPHTIRRAAAKYVAERFSSAWSSADTGDRPPTRTDGSRGSASRVSAIDLSVPNPGQPPGRAARLGRPQRPFPGHRRTYLPGIGKLRPRSQVGQSAVNNRQITMLPVTCRQTGCYADSSHWLL